MAVIKTSFDGRITSRPAILAIGRWRPSKDETAKDQRRTDGSDSNERSGHGKRIENGADGQEPNRNQTDWTGPFVLDHLVPCTASHEEALVSPMPTTALVTTTFTNSLFVLPAGLAYAAHECGHSATQLYHSDERYVRSASRCYTDAHPSINSHA